MDDALSEYLRLMIYDDFLSSVDAIVKGADPMPIHHAHESRCAPLRRLLCEQLERARIQSRSAELALRLVRHAD